MESDLMTVKEAAEYLRISVASVGVLRKKGKLPFVKLGQRVMFRKDSLAQYVANLEIVIN